jgi:hypothetical protein
VSEWKKKKIEAVAEEGDLSNLSIILGSELWKENLQNAHKDNNW